MSELLIKLGKKEFAAPARQEKEFTDCEAANALLKNLEDTPHAFVLGCLMDKQIPAERAWILPHKISQLLGSFSMAALMKCSLEKFEKWFNDKKLHRFNNEMAKVFYCAVHDIDADYGGNAAKIWNDMPRSKDVVRRFRQFHGAGPKISTMAANILVRRFRIPMLDYRAIDISADTHIRRVMLRMGLVSAEGKSETVINKMIINKACELHPDFPGVFDYACWKIGKKWCKPEKPLCANCDVRAECKKIM